VGGAACVITVGDESERRAARSARRRPPAGLATLPTTAAHAAAAPRAAPPRARIAPQLRRRARAAAGAPPQRCRIAARPPAALGASFLLMVRRVIVARDVPGLDVEVGTGERGEGGPRGESFTPAVAARSAPRAGGRPTPGRPEGARCWSVYHFGDAERAPGGAPRVGRAPALQPHGPAPSADPAPSSQATFDLASAAWVYEAVHAPAGDMLDIVSGDWVAPGTAAPPKKRAASLWRPRSAPEPDPAAPAAPGPLDAAERVMSYRVPPTFADGWLMKRERRDRGEEAGAASIAGAGATPGPPRPHPPPPHPPPSTQSAPRSPSWRRTRAPRAERGARAAGST